MRVRVFRGDYRPGSDMLWITLLINFVTTRVCDATGLILVRPVRRIYGITFTHFRPRIWLSQIAQVSLSDGGVYDVRPDQAHAKRHCTRTANSACLCVSLCAARIVRAPSPYFRAHIYSTSEEHIYQ